jgi:hypothetical protein
MRSLVAIALLTLAVLAGGCSQEMPPFPGGEADAPPVDGAGGGDGNGPPLDGAVVQDAPPLEDAPQDGLADGGLDGGPVDGGGDGGLDGPLVDGGPDAL